MAEPEEYLVLKLLTDAFDCLNIDYAIAGSIASSLYGKVRFTQDVDINAAVTAEKAGQLHSVLKAEFYIDRDAMYQAIADRASFNVVHLASAFKIDIFVRKDDDFHEQVFLRRRKIKLDELTNYFFDIVSPEDVILLKLQWYESNGRVSERQWSDVLGVLAVQAESLDMTYLKSISNKHRYGRTPGKSRQGIRRISPASLSDRCDKTRLVIPSPFDCAQGRLCRGIC